MTVSVHPADYYHSTWDVLLSTFVGTVVRTVR
jgi:hypothetical protein